VTSTSLALMQATEPATSNLPLSAGTILFAQTQPFPPVVSPAPAVAPTPAQVRPEFPMGTQVLEQVAAAAQVSQVADLFSKQAATVVQPERGEFPERVTYPKQCHGLCQRGTPSEIKQMESQVFRSLSRVLLSGSIKQDIIVACEACCEGADSPVTVCLVAFSHAIGRHGRFLATQSFASLRIIAGGSADHNYTDTIAVVEHDEYVEPHQELYSIFEWFAHNAGRTGVVSTLKEGELTSKIFSHFLPLWPGQVTLKFLSSVPHIVDHGTISGYRVTGAMEAWGSAKKTPGHPLLTHLAPQT